MPFWNHRSFARKAFLFWVATILSFAQNAPTGASPAFPPRHFDHVLIVVLENQNYESAIKNDLLKSLAQFGKDVCGIEREHRIASCSWLNGYLETTGLRLAHVLRVSVSRRNREYEDAKEFHNCRLLNLGSVVT